jgi:peptidoglycan/xylan/chitin deacetylase (PgdA/CDA1 family)
MRFVDAYYLLKPLIPRRLQLMARRAVVGRKRVLYADSWPIDEKAAKNPAGWSGWPGRKKFAVVLTHDVDTAKGHAQCKQLMEMEQRFNFRSSFNFVPERYKVSAELRKDLEANGFEVGVHGLRHDGNLFSSKEKFIEEAAQINRYIEEWGSVGFRSPCMYHNLEWIADLNIEYDASTFDTDPFEPQPDGVATIFPFLVVHGPHQKSYVELPYTLPQDFTLFVMMQEKTIEVWKTKLDWVALHGGMVLVNTHPDYMCSGGRRPNLEEYPSKLYEDLLAYIRTQHEGQYWHALPRDVARFWRDTYRPAQSPARL